LRVSRLPVVFVALVLLALPASAAESVAYYPFNGSTDDASGWGNHALAFGAVPTADRFGNLDAAYLVGTAGYLEAPDSDSLDVSNAFTLAAWLRMDEVLSEMNSVVGRSTDTGYSFAVYYGGSFVCSDPLAMRQIQASVAGCSIRFSSGPTIPCGTGEWRHVVVVFEPAAPGSSNASLYVDGNYEQTTGLGCVPVASTVPLEIGRNVYSARWFGGAIDDVRVYDSALTAGEITELFNSLLVDGFESGSVSSWTSAVP
jgi:hypothetical protein